MRLLKSRSSKNTKIVFIWFFNLNLVVSLIVLELFLFEFVWSGNWTIWNRNCNLRLSSQKSSQNIVTWEREHMKLPSAKNWVCASNLCQQHGAKKTRLFRDGLSSNGFWYLVWSSDHACLPLALFPGFFVNFPTCAFTNNFVYANGQKPQRGALDLCEFRTSGLSVKYCKSNLINSKEQSHRWYRCLQKLSGQSVRIGRMSFWQKILSSDIPPAQNLLDKKFFKKITYDPPLPSKIIF